MTGSHAVPPTGDGKAPTFTTPAARADRATASGAPDEALRLATHLQRAREAERSRVARQLHDELGGLFTAAKLDATRIRMRLGDLYPDVAERLAHLIELLNMGVKFKRRLIEELTPSSLNHLGLVAALELLLEEQGAEQSEQPALVIDHALAAVALTPAAALTAYRVVEEGLANIRRHARAAQVRVDLREDGDQALLEVADDGQGFDPESTDSTAFGLLELRYRVQAEGGRMQLRSRVGQGTRLSVWLPLSGFSAGAD